MPTIRPLLGHAHHVPKIQPKLSPFVSHHGWCCFPRQILRFSASTDPLHPVCPRKQQWFRSCMRFDAAHEEKLLPINSTAGTLPSGTLKPQKSNQAMCNISVFSGGPDELFVLHRRTWGHALSLCARSTWDVEAQKVRRMHSRRNGRTGLTNCYNCMCFYYHIHTLSLSLSLSSYTTLNY